MDTICLCSQRSIWSNLDVAVLHHRDIFVRAPYVYFRSASLPLAFEGKKIRHVPGTSTSMYVVGHTLSSTAYNETKITTAEKNIYL